MPTAMHDAPCNPKISVIVPVYNTEGYLRQCVESVLAQDYDNLEVILVDDGSPDNAGGLCDTLAGSDHRIKVIHQKNAGLGMARNSGMDLATGDYITFLDSDDWWEPNVLRKIVVKATEHNADVILFGYNAQQPDGTFRKNTVFDSDRVFDTPEALLDLSRSFIHAVPGFAPAGVPMSVWSALFHRSVARHRFHSEREVASEDLPFKAEAILKSDRAVFTPVPAVNYRYNSSSLSRTYNFEKFSRFKLLTAHLHRLYAGTAMPSAGDMCMAYASACAMQGMYCSRTPMRLRRKYLTAIANDNIWDTVRIDMGQLSRKERIVVGLLSHSHWIPVWIMAELFYAIKRLSPNRHRLSNNGI